MADLPKSNEPAHGLDDVVRSCSARLINHKDTVDGRRLWLPGHMLRLFPRTFCVSQELIDAIANFFGLIEDEQHFRSAAKLKPFDEFVAHVAFRSLQSSERAGALRFVFIRQAHVDAHGPQIGRHTHFRYHHGSGEARIFQLTRQHQAHFVPDFLGDPLHAVPSGAVGSRIHSPSSKYSISRETRSRPRIRSDSDAIASSDSSRNLPSPEILTTPTRDRCHSSWCSSSATATLKCARSLSFRLRSTCRLSLRDCASGI